MATSSVGNKRGEEMKDLDFLFAAFTLTIILGSYPTNAGAVSQTDASVSNRETAKIVFDAQLDAKHKNMIIIVLDLTGLDSKKAVTKVTVNVEFLDKNGKVIGTQQFPFSGNEDPPLMAGKKYSRRFEYNDKLPQPVAMVKPLGTVALKTTSSQAVQE
jgi:hypothetical protein